MADCFMNQENSMDINPVSSNLIKDMNDSDKPREKALRHGIKSLSDIELMAILFSTGIKGKSVLELSRDILADNSGHLCNVTRLTPTQFIKRYKGIGPAKAITLLAALELGARAASDARNYERPQITESNIAYEIMSHRFAYLDHEEFWVLLLSQSLKVIQDVRIGIGGLASTAVDVKIIIKAALEKNAAALILCHNHPSGNLRPSTQDDNLTKKISDAARIFDIRVMDHLIFADNGFFSYADNSRLT